MLAPPYDRSKSRVAIFGGLQLPLTRQFTSYTHLVTEPPALLDVTMLR